GGTAGYASLPRIAADEDADRGRSTFSARGPHSALDPPPKKSANPLMDELNSAMLCTMDSTPGPSKIRGADNPARLFARLPQWYDAYSPTGSVRAHDDGGGTSFEGDIQIGGVARPLPAGIRSSPTAEVIGVYHAVAGRARRDDALGRRSRHRVLAGSRVRGGNPQSRHRGTALDGSCAPSC